MRSMREAMMKKKAILKRRGRRKAKMEKVKKEKTRTSTIMS